MLLKLLSAGGVIIRALTPLFIQKYFSETGLPNAGPEKNRANGPQMCGVALFGLCAESKKAANTGAFEAFEAD
jgi:hypothetical protein